MMKLFGGVSLQYVEWMDRFCVCLVCLTGAAPFTLMPLFSQQRVIFTNSRASAHEPAVTYTTAVGTLSQETWQYAWVRFNSISHCSCRKTRSLSAVKVSCTAEVLQTVLTPEVQRLGFNWLEWIPVSIWGRWMNILHIAPLGKREAMIFNSFAWI